jgi:hypothetical protein
VEEKLLVNRDDKWLNVAGREKRANQRCGSRFRSRAEVCRLANLASCFILSLGVGVGQDLSKEQQEQNCQGKSKNPDPVMLRLVLTNHLDFQTTPMFSLTPGLCRSKHPAFG